MIGIVDVEVQAANPQMPLCPFVAFVGSPSSVRVRNVPGNIGSWNITKVYVSANYPDNSIQSRECTRVGEIYVGTLPACDTAGKGANGFVVSADGVDENGNAVTGYVLGKGDLEILDADGAITPGVTTHYVHGLDEQPSDPHEYDIYKDGDTWKIYFDGAWEPFAAPPTLDDAVTRTSANGVKSSGIWSMIWGALTEVIPTGFSSLYDWCVAQLAGKVPTSRTVNGKALTGNVTLTGADVAVSGTDSTKIDAALAGKADKSDLDPLLFAQYYPDGSVKSAAEFTPNIQYGSFDDVHRTVSVLPFCNTGDSNNDNSSLVGRVVIPPFVDAQGNPYISADGTRFRVVGVNSGSTRGSNTNLTAIAAPNTVTNIGGNAFLGCISLTSVSLPAAKTAGNNAFAGCISLPSVSLPAATTVGDYAFAGCAVLASVDFGDTPRPDVPSLGVGAFNNVPASCKIIVPYMQYDAWKAASGWSALPQEFVRHAEKADKPATFTTGNLAKFDAQGNPVDSGWTAGDLARYSLVAKTISNGAVSLDDRASNSVTISATLSPNTLTINFPTAPTGKLRDFSMRLNIAAGVTAPEIAWPQGVTLENNDGEVPEIADGGTGGSSTILYFSETENDGTTAKFLVKGETLTAIAR